MLQHSQPWLATWLLFCTSLPFASPLSAQDVKEGRADRELSRIIFGSCIKQEQPMPILSVMAANRPDLTILTGDNIYGDTNDMQVLRAKYRRLGENADFRRLHDAAPMLATWDDHDYGVNDGGAEYPQRIASQTAFHDFFGVPKDSPRRRQRGVYHAETFGPPGKRVQIILLDTRYFRSPLRKTDDPAKRRVGGPYFPDDAADKTMLGAPQWKWLEKTLREPADLRLLVTSIQCLASDAGQETWSNLPRERQRLLDLLRKTRANGVVMISGDRHWSELSSINNGYQLMEVTSSSLNQKHPRGTPTKNLFRHGNTTYHDVNFGQLDVNWKQADPTVNVQIRDINNQVRIQWSTPLSALHRK